MTSASPRGHIAIRFGCLASLLVGLLAPLAPASDHADPADPLRLSDDDDRGLTGLFAFPVKATGERVLNPADGNALVLILCVNRSLAKPPPYSGLDRFEFTICIDTRREVNINYPKELSKPTRPEERDTARYGGVVVHPDAINPTFTITMQLRNDLDSAFSQENFLKREVRVDRGNRLEKVEDAERARLITKWAAGVRDDPFIFPMFFGTNVIAMAIHIPYDTFPGSNTFIMWATAHRHGSQIDHVGRSQRTQLPRFDFLNTLPPREHVSAIRKMRDDPTLRQDILRIVFPTEFNFRAFDDQPDVMIFTKTQIAGYPNGRRLEDDIAKLACEQGDCQLYELSFAKPRSPESEKYSKYEGGRPTANDKPFLDVWPYLAEPWENPDPAPPPGLTTKNKIYLIGSFVLVTTFILLPWVLFFRSKAQLRRLRATLTARTPQPVSPPVAPPAPPSEIGGPQP